MPLDVALTAVAHGMHGHRTRWHARHQAAAEQTLIHLRTAYAQITGPVLAGLAGRAPGSRTRRPTAILDRPSVGARSTPPTVPYER